MVSTGIVYNVNSLTIFVNYFVDFCLGFCFKNRDRYVLKLIINADETFFFHDNNFSSALFGGGLCSVHYIANKSVIVYNKMFGKYVHNVFCFFIIVISYKDFVVLIAKRGKYNCTVV